MLFEEDTMNFKDFQNVSNLDPGIERIIKESFRIKTVIFIDYHWFKTCNISTLTVHIKIYYSTFILGYYRYRLLKIFKF